MIILSEFIVKNIRYILLKWRYKILLRFKERILRRHDFVRNNKRFTVAGNSTTQGWSLWSYDEESPTGGGDRVLQANSVCNLTRRGFLVRKYIGLGMSGLGHWTVKLKLELELELVVVDVESMGSSSSLSDFTPLSPPEMTIEIDSWNRFALDSTRKHDRMSHSEAWPPPHHRVLPAPLWSGNRGLRMGRDTSSNIIFVNGVNC